MILWDNGEVWIMENTMLENLRWYTSKYRDHRRDIARFFERSDYEMWLWFDEKEFDRGDILFMFSEAFDEYNLLTNSCISFAIILFYKITGFRFYAVTPFGLGWAIARQNYSGKGNRPKTMGPVGTIPKGVLKGPPTRIGGGGLTRGG
jgi:hypothetical protein